MWNIWLMCIIYLKYLVDMCVHDVHVYDSFNEKKYLMKEKFESWKFGKSKSLWSRDGSYTCRNIFIDRKKGIKLF